MILQVLTGKKAGTKFELKKDVVTMGRHPECDIPLDGNSVSRFHAHVIKCSAGYEIEDQKSRNGTIVNGKKIEGRTTLTDNDRVKICETLFVFRVEPDPTDALGNSTAETPAFDDDRPSTVLSSLDAQSSSLFSNGVKPEAKLKAIYEVSQAIAQTLDLDMIFDKVLESAFKIFPHADRGIVIEADPNGRFLPRATRQRREEDESIRFSRTVVQTALDEKKAILSADASSDERFSLSESIADFRIRSVMCVPLLGVNQRPLGAIQLDTQSYNHRFSEDDLQVLCSVANQAAIAMENARLHAETINQERIRRELAFARQVQQGFLPRNMPMIPGYEFWAFYEAAGQVGGDYYDFVTLPDGRQAVLVADVSGKGVPAALLMARFSSDAKVSLITNSEDPALAVAKLNGMLCDAGLDDRFVTFSLTIVDPERNVVQIVSAGHMSPIVRLPDGSIVEPAGDENASSLPLGIFSNAEYHLVEFAIPVGTQVVVYSDGINEAMNTSNEEYSSQRLRLNLASFQEVGKELGERLIRDVRGFSAGRSQHDDMTLVVFSRLSG
jgi:serine phosphatase RsbU (regulator of sigma subunit)/pSer/pThr/pTyr-binding forkhead associated (FHA) protein